MAEKLEEIEIIMIFIDDQGKGVEIGMKDLDRLNEWLDFAETDLKTAMLLYRRGQERKNGHIFYRHSLYHLEQASEKIGKVYVWQVVNQICLTFSFLGEDAAQKYRESYNVIKKLTKAKGKDFGHTPSVAINDVIKFLKLYKEGEAYRLMMDFMHLAEVRVLDTLQLERCSDQERLLKEQFQVLYEMLRKHCETVKVSEIKKDKGYEAPNYEKLESGLVSCNKVNLAFDRFIQSVDELEINDFASQIKPFIEFDAKTNVKKVRHELNAFKEFLILMLFYWKGFIDSLILWDLLSVFVEARYPDLKIDDRTYELVSRLNEMIMQTSMSARQFNNRLQDMQSKAA